MNILKKIYKKLEELDGQRAEPVYFTGVLFKISNNKATLDDQDDALKHPQVAYRFACHVKGADIEKCQEVACKDLYYAYLFARDISGANIEKCQDTACKDPQCAYWFALDVPEADIEKCQEAACKSISIAYLFARDVQGADLEKIRKLYPQMSDDIDELIMNKVLM